MTDHHPPTSPPIVPLWVVEKGDELRAASLFAHELGLEIRIVDRAGLFVRTEVLKTTNEADAVQVAATIEDGYKSRGWTPISSS